MEDAKMAFARTVRALESGEIRVARKVNGTWVVDTAVKEAILAGFKAGQLTDQSLGAFSFIEKDTLPLHAFAPGDRVRIVPGGSSVRCGAYLAPSVIMMPPSYVNIGAYVDEGTMLDSHSLVGSCAQVGKHVHLSAASQLGGVLEPAGALPVIIEDGVFIGGNCGIYEGTLVGERAVVPDDGTRLAVPGRNARVDALVADIHREVGPCAPVLGIERLVKEVWICRERRVEQRDAGFSGAVRFRVIQNELLFLIGVVHTIASSSR